MSEGFLTRRGALRLAGAAAGLGSLGLAGCALNPIGTPDAARVLVVGGGYGGATAAKYVRLLSGYKIEVVLVEPDAAFVSCPLSNLVLGGSRTLSDITRPYETLTRQHGVRVVQDMVASIDPTRRVAVLASGGQIRYDKLVLSPGVEMMWETVAGLRAANQSGASFRPGGPGLKRSPCAASSKRCPTAACSRSRSPRHRIVARRGLTNAPRSSPVTSRRTSRARRC
jgi:NADPH-dependent 2,4-dienoyl-CoA reductase/sulfur reductase-like enzyme